MDAYRMCSGYLLLNDCETRSEKRQRKGKSSKQRHKGTFQRLDYSAFYPGKGEGSRVRVPG